MPHNGGMQGRIRSAADSRIILHEQENPERDPHISYDAFGRRCVQPPDHIVIDWELRTWHELYDAVKARAKANADGAAHRLKYGPEQLNEDKILDKRRNGNKHARQTG